MEIMRSKMQQVQMGKAVKNNLWITDPEEVDDPEVLPELPGFHVLVRPVSVKSQTKGGILLPDSTKDDISYLTTVGKVVALEQAKVELEKQKLQSDTMVQAAEMELKNKKLELDENEQLIDMLKDGATENFKKEKAELDRESKKELKSLEILGKLGIEEAKINSQDERAKEKIMKEILEQNKKDKRDLDMKGLEALVKLAIEKSKEEQ